ncbi:hypothetical protein OLK001_25440 [Synechocystis sp. LKSZ1]
MGRRAAKGGMRSREEKSKSMKIHYDDLNVSIDTVNRAIFALSYVSVAAELL